MNTLPLLVARAIARFANASVILTTVAALSGCAGYVPGAKSFWDSKVKEMCEKDGGVRIFHKLQISKEQAALLSYRGSKLSIPVKELAPANAPAFAVLQKTTIREREPVITRSEGTVYRRSDHAVLAKWVAYMRTGGDLLTVDYPSTYSCPDVQTIQTDLQAVFEIEGQSQ